MFCLWCEGILGKEQSKCFWIEDYRPAHSRNRLAELEEREGKGWARVDEVRAAAPRKMRRRKAAERRGRQWRGRETARGFIFRITISIKKKQSRVHFPSLLLLCSQVFLPAFTHFNDTTLTFLQIFQQGPYTGKIHPVSLN